MLHLDANGRAARGFTLIEIMVVVVILGLLTTLVATNAGQSADDAKVRKAQVDTRMLAEAVRMHYVAHSRLPTLEQLAQRDERGRLAIESLPRDPWDGDYVLREGTHPGEFTIVSAGPNRIPGDDDDIAWLPAAAGNR